MMRRSLFLIGAIQVLASGAFLEAAEPSYPEVARQRAAKIVEMIELEDDRIRDAVIACVADQYVQLHALDEVEQRTVEALKGLLSEVSNTTYERTAAVLRDGIALEVQARHRSYLARLAALLTPAQVEVVKNGMTYGVLPGTYAVYRELIPDLDEEGQRQIMAWLVEAREVALTAGSAEEKHRVFGKYKGRINNFLSAAGYDLKAAERAMWERRKQADGASPHP